MSRRLIDLIETRRNRGIDEVANEGVVLNDDNDPSLVRLLEDATNWRDVGPFRTRLTMTHGVFRRFSIYRRLPAAERRTNFFRTTDSLSIHVWPGPDASEMFLDLGAMTDALVAVFQTLGVPDVPATVDIGLQRHSTIVSSRLGGNASVLLNLASLYSVEGGVVDFFERIQESGYHGFNLADITFRFDVALRDLAPLLLRGGCYSSTLNAIGQLSIAEAFPFSFRLTRHVPLWDFSKWKPQERTFWSRHTLKNQPKSCNDTRGLYSFGWNEAWQPVCGVMSLLFGMCLMFARSDAYHNDNQTDKDRAYWRELLVDLHDEPNLLHSLAVDVLLSFGLPLDPCSMGLLGMIADEICPKVNVVFVDASHKILFRHTGRQSVFPDDIPEVGYKYSLVEEDILKRVSCRLGIFYDHTHCHYLPVLDWDTFYHVTSKEGTPFGVGAKRLRKGVLTAVQSDPAYSSTSEASANWSKRISDVVWPCPYCDVMVVRKKLKDHHCNVQMCEGCLHAISNAEDRRRHLFSPNQRKGERCGTCRRSMASKECLKIHQLVCGLEVKVRCKFCRFSYNPLREKHSACRTFYCGECKKTVRNPVIDDKCSDIYYQAIHDCDMKHRFSKKGDQSISESLSGKQFFAFDFESTLDDSTSLSVSPIDCFNGVPVYLHTVNTIGYSKIDLISYLCDKEINACVEDTVIVSSLDAFYRNVLDRSANAAENVWFAHNLKGYDGRLLFDFLQDQNILPVDIMWRGGKIMSMEYTHPQLPSCRIIFRDSLNHIPCSLAKIPSMFSLPVTLRKGFFPYHFNTTIRRFYRGVIPDRKYFEPHTMSKQRQLEFDGWYNEQQQKGCLYDLKYEREEYCKNDVAVLAYGLLAYAKTCFVTSRILPLDYLTIAEYTFRHFMESFLPERTLYKLCAHDSAFCRRALHGGNTNVRRLLFQCDPELSKQKKAGARYIDVVSLYPTVQYYDPMPVGRPTINYYKRYDDGETLLPQPLLNPSSFFGFVECDIRPKKYSHHPLLGQYNSGKLEMPLRLLEKVVLTSAEFFEATGDDGDYECVCIWKTMAFRSSTNLFRGFVKKWLKLKITQSKLPFSRDDPNFETLFRAFAEETKKELDIDLSPGDFPDQPNVSMRSFSKLILNSLWGKFGQRDDLIKCVIMKNAYELFDYEVKKRVGRLVEVKEQMVGGGSRMKYFKDTMFHPTKNVAVAAFVTAHARIRLWKVMKRLGTRVLYHDTDSVIYETDNGRCLIEEGIRLGQWESETKEYLIHDFVSIAPKTYAYRYYEGDKLVEVVKAKGFTLTDSDKAVSFDSLVRMVAASLIPWFSFQSVTLSTPQRFPALKAAADDIASKGDEKQSRRIGVENLFFRHLPLEKETVSYRDRKWLSFKYEKGLIDSKTLATLPPGTKDYFGCREFQKQFPGCEDYRVIDMGESSQIGEVEFDVSMSQLSAPLSQSVPSGSFSLLDWIDFE